LSVADDIDADLDDDRAVAAVRALLAERIGPVAHQVLVDERLIDLGVPSIDVVAVVAALERDAVGPDTGGPAGLADIGESVRALARYGLSIGALT
jgi:hypothetical protein